MAEDTDVSSDVSSSDSDDESNILSRTKRETGDLVAKCEYPWWKLPSGNPTTNPIFGNRVHLNCKNGYLYLAIYPDGSVKGTDDRSEYTMLELVSVGHGGALKIRGLQAGMFLTMDEKGSITAVADTKDETTVFKQGICGLYQTFLSEALKWYLGIRKCGRMMNGKKTKENHKGVQYLSVRIETDSD